MVANWFISLIFVFMLAMPAAFPCTLKNIPLPTAIIKVIIIG